MTKIFQFADFDQSFQRVLGYNLVSHDAFILLTVHGIMSLSFICFLFHPQNDVGKIVVYSSLSFVLVKTSKSVMIFIKFALAGLFKLILFLVSSLVMRTTKNF
jgi:hypothetical protein